MVFAGLPIYVDDKFQFWSEIGIRYSFVGLWQDYLDDMSRCGYGPDHTKDAAWQDYLDDMSSCAYRDDQIEDWFMTFASLCGRDLAKHMYVVIVLMKWDYFWCVIHLYEC